MKKSLFFVALGALALTSCSQDEVKQVNQDAVEFSVVAENASRGDVIYTNEIDAFNVTAYLTETTNLSDGTTVTTNGNTFMNGVDVTKVDGVWQYDVLKYWPNSGAVNFYSYAPLSLVDYGTVDFGKQAQTITYTVPEECDKQIDVLYAFNKGLTKTTNSVQVNFRHALSQIVFKARNTKDDLRIVIDGVRVVYVSNSGTLTMPTESTTVQAADAVVESDATWGTWAVVDDPKYSFASILADESIELTTANQNYDLIDKTDPLLLMPQELKPATITDNKMAFDGAYFAIKCKIFSVENGEEIQLWPTVAGETAEVAIPVSSPDKVVEDGKTKYFWKQGRRYVYTFKFGEGAGYIGEDLENEGDPVLVPVTFEVTVDKFQDAVQAVDMNTGN